MKLKSVFLVILFGVTLVKCTTFASSTNVTTDKSEAEFIRKAGEFANRMLWMTHRRKLVLPKGTILTLTPKITVPVFRHKPFNGGLNSDIQASWVFYMYFDKLGMTSDQHPWPLDMPPFYPFGDMMRPKPEEEKESKDKLKNKNDNSMYENRPFPNIIKGTSGESEEDEKKNLHTIRNLNMYPAFYSQRKLHRKPRGVMSLPPPESIHAGERAIIMPSIEALMSNMGFEGRSCLLRAICEVHEFPMSNGFGLFGEILTLFFSISESPYAETHMPEYLRAEQDGKSGDCSFYYKNCTKSIFTWEPKGTLAEEIENNFVEK